jgi:transcriptional regulator with XRE-family HTH domain
VFVMQAVCYETVSRVKQNRRETFDELYTAAYGPGVSRDMSNEVGAKIARLREERSWTQQQLADAAHLARTTLADYERGGKWPKGENLKRLAKALGVSVDELGPAYDPEAPRAHRKRFKQEGPVADDRNTPGQGERGIGDYTTMQDAWLEEPYVREIARAAAKLPEQERGELLLDLLGRAIKGGIGTKAKNQ